MLKPTTRRRWLVVLIVLQVLVLAGMALSSEAAGWYGKEIKLKTAPVDPRDLFYGDYVILSYEISRLDRGLWTGSEQPERREIVYVKLRRAAGEEGIYEAVSVSPERPETTGDEAVLKARVGYVAPDTIQLTYGLERYYVPEGTGRELEEQREEMLVTVRIAPWGQARLMSLILP